MPSQFLLWDRVRALAAKHRVHQAERNFQDQSDLERLLAGSEYLGAASGQSSILDQTNLQLHRLERYKDYEQMDQTGEISLALDLYADEASLVDPERKHTIIIRAHSRRLKRELEELFFNTLSWDNYCRPAIRYLCKYGDFPAEMVTDKHRTGVSALKFINVYNFTRIETRHGDLVGFFHQDETNQQPLFLHPWQVMHLRLTSFENIYAPYGRCQAFGSRLATPTGYKCIEDFRPDDAVYSYHDGKLVETKVIAACHSGEKRTYRIKTKHFSNDWSGTHPVMVRQWNKRDFKFGQKWFADLVYKRADELRIGDELVIPRIGHVERPRPMPTPGTLERLDDRVSNADVDFGSQHGTTRIALPKFVDAAFARFFGFMLGDGWLLRPNGAHRGVAFALGVDEEINSRYESQLSAYGMRPTRRKKSESKSSLPHDVVVANSGDFCKVMEELGFVNGCTKKRMPDWAYTLPVRSKEELIDGLVDSDGSANVDEWGCERYQIELTNRELVEDVKLLIHSIGWKCGHVLKRRRKSGETNIHGKLYKRRQSWIVYFYKSDLFASAGSSGCYAGPKSRDAECARFGPDVIFEPVVSIEDAGLQQTADIQVEHMASNFVSNGVVAHNSIIDAGRKAFKQLRLMEDAALIYRITRAPERLKFKIPVGNIPQKEVPEYMQLIARQFKRQRFYNPTTGTFDERYSPLIQEDNFYLPQRPDGSGPDIEQLPGGQNLDQIADIEYFKKKMIAPTKIPYARVGIGEGSGEANEKSLSQSSSEFAKAVQWVQREVVNGLTKVAICHLALRGYSIDDIKGFELAMSATSAMEELYRIETWQTRTGVMLELKELGWFPKSWIITHFTDLTPDEIEELKELESAEAMGGDGIQQGDDDGGGMSGGMGGGGLGDLGGDEMGNEMGDAGADAGPQPEDQNKLDDLLGGAEGAEEPPSEGYDKEAQKRLLNELKMYKERGDKRKVKELLESLAARVGKDTSRDDYRPMNQYVALLENKELDGLSRNRPLLPGSVYSPNGDDQLLIEWSVPKEERESAIEEIRSLLVEAPAAAVEDDGVVMLEDLPST